MTQTVMWNLEERMRRMKKKTGEKRKREEEKEEKQTERVKRRGDGLVSVEAFEIFSQDADLESCCGLGETPWTSLRTGLTMSLIPLRLCVWCLM